MENTGSANIAFRQSIAYAESGHVVGHEMVAYSKVQKWNPQFCFILNCSTEFYKSSSDNKKGQ
jgi:hypothetical protein